MLGLSLSREDLELLSCVLYDQIGTAEAVLEVRIDGDQTPETIDEFLDVVSTAQDEIAAMQDLLRRIKGELNGH